jgi:hypothetical protein
MPIYAAGQSSLPQDRDRQLLALIFGFAAERDLESVELMLVLADAVAAVAATLDTHDVPQKLSDRLDAFVARVEERHPEIMKEMVLKRAAGG